MNKVQQIKKTCNKNLGLCSMGKCIKTCSKYLLDDTTICKFAF